MNVELPNGYVIEGVPEGTPKSAIMKKAIAAGWATEQDFLGAMPAPAAGETMPVEGEGFTPTGASPRALRASKLRHKRETEREAFLSTLPPEQRALLEGISGPEAFLIGMGRGFSTVGRGVGLMDDETQQQRQAMEQLERVQPVATRGGEILGEAAPFVPLGMGASGLAKTTAQRALATGATGALEGGTLAAGKGGDAAEVVQGALVGATLGAGTELAFPIISRAGRRVYNKLTGKSGEGVKAIDDLLTPSGIDPDAAKALAKDGVEVDEFLRQTIDEADMSNDQRRAVFESLGLDPTVAQITRDKDLFQQQIESASRSGEVTKALERQERILNDVTKGELRAIDGVGARAGTSTSNAIIDKAVELDEQINDLYRMAREAAPNIKNVRFDNTAGILRQNASSDNLGGGIVNAIKGQMEQMGVIDGFRPSGRVSIDQAEELRKTINRLSRSATPEGKYIAGQIKDALDRDALAAAGEDFYKQARKAKFDFERGLSTEGKSKFSKRGTSLVRDILEEKIPEEKIAEKVIGRGSKYDAKSLKELKTYLQTGSEGQVAQGSQAWNDIRANAFERILSDSFKGPIDQFGNKSLSRAGLEKAFRQIGPEKMSVLFSDKEMAFLRKLAQVSALKEAPPSVAKSPSGAAIRELQKKVLDNMQRIPGLKIVGGELDELLTNQVNRATDKKLLQALATDSELIREQAEKAFIENMRKSKMGYLTAATLPAAGVSAQQDTTNQNQ